MDETIEAALMQAGAQINALQANERRLIDELAAVRKVAERYRFLRDDFSPMGLNIDGNHAWAYRRNATLKGPSLDAAIDEAMSRADLSSNP